MANEETNSHFLKPRILGLLIVGVVFIIIAITGNSLVVMAVRKKRTLRTTTNILLANVAVADLITTFFIPFISLQSSISLPNGIWADLLCKFVMDYHVPMTCSSVSILTLTVLSVERYHAIVKPMRSGARLTEDTVKYAIIAVWVFAILITSPVYIFGRYNKSDRMCKNGYPEHIDFYGSSVVPFTVLIVLLPLAVTFFCYFQVVKELYFKKSVAPQNNALAEADNHSKRKLIKVALSVTAANTAFLLPLGIAGILKYFGKVSHEVFTLSASIFFLENAINPFLYSFQSTNFRQAFKEILKWKA